MDEVENEFASDAPDAPGAANPMRPEDAVVIIDEAREKTRRGVAASTVTMLTVWGAAWLLGFLTLWSGEALGGNPLFRLPDTLVAWVFGGLIAIAVITSILVSALMRRGTRGRSNTSGALYAWTWSIGMVATWLVSSALMRNGLAPELIPVVVPGLFVLVAGVLMAAGGAVSRSTPQFALGVGLMASAVLGTIVGSPNGLVVYALGGGLAMLMFALLLWIGAVATEGTRRD